MSDYERIARAIDYIVEHAGDGPTLAEIAADASLSPFHFQRLFSRWAGVSPKRFLQLVTVERAKRLLDAGRNSLLGTSEDLGLSSSSRLHDHFVTLEAMTPDEFRRGGSGLEIRYGEAGTPYGRAFFAATDRGLCALSFVDPEGGGAALAELRQRWPFAAVREDRQMAGRLARRLFDAAAAEGRPLSVLVRGTNFQVAVWRALLAIPEGAVVAYGDIARQLGRPKAVRAVGSAVGANPCAFVIPCHRVIRDSGALGGYRWGLTRKQAMLSREAARIAEADGMPVRAGASKDREAARRA